MINIYEFFYVFVLVAKQIKEFCKSIVRYYHKPVCSAGSLVAVKIDISNWMRIRERFKGRFYMYAMKELYKPQLCIVLEVLPKHFSCFEAQDSIDRAGYKIDFNGTPVILNSYNFKVLD